MKAKVVILDFGSQYTQLIARCVREIGVYCEILPGNSSADKVLASSPSALIFSGGPASVKDDNSPRADKKVLNSGIPIFAICYGMQLIADEHQGVVQRWSDEDSSGVREYGPAAVCINEAIGPLAHFQSHEEITVWMSHGDKVAELPQGFKTIASSSGAPIAAFANEDKKIYGVQFHPEVHHSPRGKEIISAFLFDVAGLDKDWNSEGFINDTIESIKKKVPTGNVVCAISGGVDSTVASVLVHRAIGDRLHCFFVDNGLLRHNEGDDVMKMLNELGLNVTRINAQGKFLSELEGVIDPEQKRKIIGRVFIDLFEEEAGRISDVQYLVQGTLYPDVIESISVVGSSATIKSHHNVGGLKENMKLDLIEPLRELFKDEVRKIGRDLGIDEKFIARQPFPGPGLAVRCLGEVAEEKLKILRKADKIFCDEVIMAGLETTIWQWFAVLLPVQSVGVMGDGRTYDQTIGLRAVTSRDGMTADWFMFPEALLRKISSRIINETDGVNRVVLDISTKPPSTIEWE